MPNIVEPSSWNLARDATRNGCFETMRAYRGRIFRLEAHLDRLDASCRYLGLRPPANRRRLAERLRQAIAAARLKDAGVRVALMPREGEAAEPSIVVQAIRPPSSTMYRRGIRLAIVPTRKLSVSTIDPQAKSSARLGSVLAVIDAQLRGADEALWVDAMGYVTESTASNFGIVREGAVLTPPCHLGLLAGITRDVLFEVARELRIAIQEVPLTRHDVYNAAEAFLLSTIKEILPVVNVDGWVIGTGKPGPITRRLLQAFRRLVQKELKTSWSP
jgi:branched-chain amino acid aminotransferase